MAMWAPVALLGIEVNRLSGGGDSSTASYRPLDSVEMSEMNDRSSSQLERGPDQTDREPKAGSSGELSGIYFGILNIYTTIPQFIGTFISTIVFAIFAPGTHPDLHGRGEDGSKATPSTEGPNAISICLFIGAMSATVAIFATRKLKYL